MALVKGDNFKSDISKPNACCMRHKSLPIKIKTASNALEQIANIMRQVINLIKNLQND